MLTKCPECGHDVSTNAEKCLNCGTSINKTSRVLVGLKLFVTIFTFIITVLSLISITLGNIPDWCTNFTKSIYPKSIIYSENEFSSLNNMRFGLSINFPEKWGRKNSGNNSSIIFYEPSSGNKIYISILSSFFSGNPSYLLPKEIKDETIDSYIKYIKKDLSEPVVFYPKEFKTYISGIQKNVYDLQSFQIGYKYKVENYKEGYNSLHFVAKYWGVWHFITFVAPSNVYARYEDLFSKILDSFRIVIQKDTDRVLYLDDLMLKDAINQPF